MSIQVENVKDYFLNLQARICSALEGEERAARFQDDLWEHATGGGGRTRVLSGGETFEQAGVNFSHVSGGDLPPAASAARPEIAGRRFQALGVSLVVHPFNPYVPTSHANVRLLLAEADDKPPVWWFGGGFDLTPFYPFEEDVVHWHREALDACRPFGENVYGKYKRWCDEYFFLKHRNETRGVGGLFFDDLNEWGFERCFAFVRSVGDHIRALIYPSSGGEKTRPSGSANVRFNSIAADAMSNSTSFTTAEPCSGFSRAAGRNRSLCRCPRS